jgi:hypothetical protein
MIAKYAFVCKFSFISNIHKQVVCFALNTFSNCRWLDFKGTLDIYERNRRPICCEFFEKNVKMSGCPLVWCDMIKEFWLRVVFKKQARLRGLSGGVT